MAPTRTHPSPETVIVGKLAEARRLGMSFADAWHLVVLGAGRMILTNDSHPPPLSILWPTDRAARLDVREAILSSRDSFQRAYERRPPTASDLAVRELHALLSETDRAPAVMPIWSTANGIEKPRSRRSDTRRDQRRAATEADIERPLSPV